MRYKAAKYVIYDDVLYRRGFNTPLINFVDGTECNDIMREVHEGICGTRSGVDLWQNKHFIKGTTGPL